MSWGAKEKAQYIAGPFSDQTAKQLWEATVVAWNEDDQVTAEYCAGCGNKIDSKICGCGERMHEHLNPAYSDHLPTPAGCTCRK